jgi:hypothetical protein
MWLLHGTGIFVIFSIVFLMWKWDDDVESFTGNRIESNGEVKLVVQEIF